MPDGVIIAFRNGRFSLPATVTAAFASRKALVGGDSSIANPVRQTGITEAITKKRHLDKLTQRPAEFQLRPSEMRGAAPDPFRIGVFF
jgi:hypothetical protein